MAFTVTATESGASSSHGVALLVRVLTNATESGGATSGSTGGGVTAQGSLTPNFSSSYIAFSVSADNVTSMPAAATNNTYDLTTGNPSDVWSTAQGHYTGTVTAATPLTYGAGSVGAGDHANWCAYEIPASGGTITLDGSSPAGVISGSGLGSGTAATTASFTPPTGAVLVAEVCAGGTGAGAGITMTITDTSGLGLVWTRRAVSSTSDNFQPTWVYTTTVPATFTGISTTGRQAFPGRTWLSQFRQPQHQPEVLPAPPVPAYPPQQQAQPGPAWKAKFRLPQRPKPTAPVLPPYIAALSGGTSGWFVDQNATPRLYFATVPWGLPANAGRWNGGDWRSDFDSYFAAIAAQGMTAAEMHVWGHSHTGCSNDIGNTWDSVSPWTTIPTLNGTYWQRIDALLNSALQHGITVFLNLTMQCDMGMDAFSGTGVFNGTSASTIQTACQNIAARYVNQPNLVWMHGDDYNNNDDTRMNAALAGLRAGGYTGPTSIEYYSTGTTSRRDLSGSPTGTQFPWGAANATFNWCYYYNVTYFAVEQAYKENSQIPVVWGDGFYVGGGAGEPADTHLMRNFVWWALASGARGVSMGSESILNWQSTAMADVTANQLWYVNEAKAVYTAFSSLAGWQNLVPDLASALVTAGRGSRAAYSATNFQAANLGSDNYVAASITPDGSLAVIYCAVAMSITIDQTKLGSGYTATWVDPANGATQPTTTGTTYASSGLGNNSAGNADWVLVLQGPQLTVSGTAAPAGAGAVTAVATQAVTASLAGAGSVTANASVITAGSTATLAGAGAVAAVVTQAVIASPAGAGSVTTAVTQTATATLAGAGAVTAKVTQAVIASPAGAGAVSDVATQAVTASLAGAGSVTDVVTQIATASLTGAGALTANVAGAGSTANLAGAGAVTALATVAATATAAGAGAVTAAVTQLGSASLTGAGSVTAAGQITGTANLTAAGALSAKAAQAVTAQAAGAGAMAALATQGATATAAGAGSVTAVSGTQAAFTVGQLSATAAAGSTLTAATAPLSVLTATDQRTGGSGG